MLKRVLVKINVIVVVVRIGEELVIDGEHPGCGHIAFRKEQAFRLGCHHDAVTLKAEVLPLLVAQVRVHGALTGDLEWTFYPYGSMVGGDHHASFFGRHNLHHIPQR